MRYSWSRSRAPGGKPGHGRTDRWSARRAGLIPVWSQTGLGAYCGPATAGADMPSAQIGRGQLDFYAVRPRRRPGGGPSRRPSRPRSMSSCTGPPPPRLADSKSLPRAFREAATTNPRSRVELTPRLEAALAEEIRNAVARLGDRLRDVLRRPTRSTSTSSSVASPNAVARDTARAGSAARRSPKTTDAISSTGSPRRVHGRQGNGGAGIRHQSSWSTETTRPFAASTFTSWSPTSTPDTSPAPACSKVDVVERARRGPTRGRDGLRPVIRACGGRLSSYDAAVAAPAG